MKTIKLYENTQFENSPKRSPKKILTAFIIIAVLAGLIAAGIRLQYLANRSDEQEFWDWFSRHRAKISDIGNNDEILAQLREKLGKVYDVFDFELTRDADRYTVFTVCGDMKKLFSKLFILKRLGNGELLIHDDIFAGDSYSRHLSDLQRSVPRLNGWKIYIGRQISHFNNTFVYNDVSLEKEETLLATGPGSCPVGFCMAMYFGIDGYSDKLDDRQRINYHILGLMMIIDTIGEYFYFRDYIPLILYDRDKLDYAMNHGRYTYRPLTPEAFEIMSY